MRTRDSRPVSTLHISPPNWGAAGAACKATWELGQHVFRTDHAPTPDRPAPWIGDGLVEKAGHNGLFSGLHPPRPMVDRSFHAHALCVRAVGAPTHIVDRRYPPWCLEAQCRGLRGRIKRLHCRLMPAVPSKQ